jgi:hypothetical protein
MAIVITGSVAYDYLMTFPGHFREQILPEKLNEISLSFLVDTMTRQRGGIAPNIAYTMALLGEKPKILATVGQDFAEYRAWLESKGIDTSYILEIPEKYTASFFANTDLDNCQIASFYTRAMADAGKVSIKGMKQGYADYVVISPNDPGAMDQYVRECVDWVCRISTIPPSRLRATITASCAAAWKMPMPSSATNTNMSCCKNTPVWMPKPLKDMPSWWWSPSEKKARWSNRRARATRFPSYRPRKLRTPPVWVSFPRRFLARIPPWL